MMFSLTQVMSIFMGAAMVLSIRQELKLAEARLGADILIYPTQAMSKVSKDKLLMQGTPVEVYKSRSMLTRLSECENLDAVSYQIYITDRTDEDQAIRIVGYEPETDFAVAPWIAEGPNFVPADNTVIIGSRVQSGSEDPVTLFHRQWPVSGHLLETGSELDTMVFVNMVTLKTLIQAAADSGIRNYSQIDPEAAWSAALIHVNDKENVDSVANWINIYVRKVTAIRSENSLTSTASDIQKHIKPVIVIALAAWLILLLAMAIVQFMLMHGRKKELFVWRTIGASQRIIARIILQEAFWTHLAGGLAGALISGLLIVLFGSRFLPGTEIPGTSIWMAAVPALLISLAAGCLGSWLSLRKTAAETSGQMLISY